MARDSRVLPLDRVRPGPLRHQWHGCSTSSTRVTGGGVTRAAVTACLVFSDETSLGLPVAFSAAGGGLIGSFAAETDSAGGSTAGATAVTVGAIGTAVTTGADARSPSGKGKTPTAIPRPAKANALTDAAASKINGCGCVEDGTVSAVMANGWVSGRLKHSPPPSGRYVAQSSLTSLTKTQMRCRRYRR